MNNWVGGIIWPGAGLDGGWGSNWVVYRKMSDMHDPGPARTWVFIDEREESIDDSVWITSMKGFRDASLKYELVNYPASYHGHAGTVSFSDGHAELRKWNDQRTLPKPYSNAKSSPVPSAGNIDIEWLQERTTRPR
jgi:prepilin-type processing-associated H-X9-DG protein